MNLTRPRALQISAYAWLVVSVLAWRPAPTQEAAGIAFRVPPQQELDSAQSAATELAAKIDIAASSNSQWTDFYKTAGLALQTRYSAAAFAARIAQIRGPLGAVQERSFSGFFGPYHKLPNLIEGEYLIVVFATQFKEQQRPYTEQITLETGRPGAPNWTLVEYYVAPK